MIEVALTQEELNYAILVGTRRHNEHLESHTDSPNDRVIKNGYLINQIGAIAEYAVAKTLGVHWEGKYFEDSMNVKQNYHDLKGIEVRSTIYENGGLLLKDNEKGDPRKMNTPFVLVIMKNWKRPKIVGWLYGKEICRDVFWRDDVPRPCWIAPQNRLNNIMSLQNQGGA